MLPEPLAHARLEDRDMAIGVSSLPMHDADAAIATMTAVDEPLCADHCLGESLTMQVESGAWTMVSTFQLPEFTPIDARSDKPIRRIVNVARFARRRRGRGPDPWEASHWRGANAAARIGREADDIGHLLREVFTVARRGPLLHSAIVCVVVGGRLKPT
jgi:hypothetical protein